AGVVVLASAAIVYAVFAIDAQRSRDNPKPDQPGPTAAATDARRTEPDQPRSAEEAMAEGNKYNASQDYSQALSWYRKAADQGYGPAQRALGVMYAHGQGVPQDDAQALSWYRKAAEGGDSDAQRVVGEMYEQGKGAPRDYAQALSWFRKSADQVDAN